MAGYLLRISAGTAAGTVIAGERDEFVVCRTQMRSGKPTGDGDLPRPRSGRRW
ncbi:MAG: hypothetical protein JOZ07_17600 [Solirubrobacterales bacterium]|nr:hypothetical protein [Solirubrobacterales bacterium]